MKAPDLKKNKKCCYYCKWRQKERKPEPKLICQLIDREMGPEDWCPKYEFRWPNEDKRKINKKRTRRVARNRQHSPRS